MVAHDNITFNAIFLAFAKKASKRFGGSIVNKLPAIYNITAVNDALDVVFSEVWKKYLVIELVKVVGECYRVTSGAPVGIIDKSNFSHAYFFFSGGAISDFS
jgi:hypothetical protein